MKCRPVTILHNIACICLFALAISDANAQVWIPLNPPVSIELKCGFFMDDEHIVAVGQDGTIVHSDNGGLTWLGEQDKERGWLATAAYKQGGSFVIAGGTDGLLMSSSDYGVNWKNIPTGMPTGSFIFGSQVVDEQTFYLAGGTPESGVVMKTTDAGVSWTTTAIDSMYFLERVIFRNDQLGYTCGTTRSGGGKIYKTTDGGTSWKPIYESQEGFVTSIQCPTDQHLFGTMTMFDASGGMLLRSTNGGITWGEEKVVDHEMTSTFFIDADRGYACGSGLIRYTSNGGVQWNNTDYTGFQNINYLHVTGDRVLAVGTNGVLLESMIPSSVDEPAPVASSVHPNPARQHVRITSPLHGAQSIAIYDVLGRVVLKKDIGGEVSVERNGLPNGVYHYTITTSAGELATKGSFVFE